MPRLGPTISMLARARTMSASRGPRSVLQEAADFGANPGNLALLSHVPDDLAAQAPLVVALHGCTQSAEGYAMGAGWIEAAERFGFALLCPEQSTANNPNLCFNWFVPNDIRRGGGEAASIANMVKHMIAEHDLDASRVFITGLSAGGAMANVMLATYPEVFSAGAIIAGLPYGSAGNVQEAFAAMAHQRHDSDEVLGARVRSAQGDRVAPWPRVSVWHGTSDATVSPQAGLAIARQWANVHDASSAQAAPVGARRRQSWQSADGTIVVEHHAIPGMGHGTPLDMAGVDAVGAAGPYLLDVGVSSTLEIIEAWGLTARPADRPASIGAPTPQVELASVSAAPPPAEAELVLAPSDTPQPIPAPLRRKRAESGKTGGIDIGEVINNALRAAGLLK